MAQCGGISADILIDCDNPPIAGTKDTLYLFNLDGVDFTYNTTGITPQKIVDGITLPSGQTLFKIEGRNNSITASAELVKGTYFDSYQHNVGFAAFDITPETKAQIEKMVQSGNLCAIVENANRSATGNTAFEIYGITNGLEVLTGVRNVLENDGIYVLQLGSSELVKEPHLPFSVFDTDYATTLAMIEALL